MSLTTVTAEDINLAHGMAQIGAREAIEHAIRCGELLSRKKKEMPHGSFIPWVKSNCQFGYSTAARYMKAAQQNFTGVEITSLRALFPSGSRLPASPLPTSPAPSDPQLESKTKSPAKENGSPRRCNRAIAPKVGTQEHSVAPARRSSGENADVKQRSAKIRAAENRDSARGKRKFDIVRMILRSTHVPIELTALAVPPFFRADAIRQAEELVEFLEKFVRHLRDVPARISSESKSAVH